MSRTILLLAGLSAAIALHAQNNVAHDTLVVFGVVKDLDEKPIVRGLEVLAMDVNDPKHVLSAALWDPNHYEFYFTEERTYRIIYSAPGFISKSVQIAVAGPTAEQWKGGFGMEVDIRLPSKKSGHDPALYKEPMGMGGYNADSLRFDWDPEYTRARMEEVSKAMGK